MMLILLLAIWSLTNASELNTEVTKLVEQLKLIKREIRFMIINCLDRLEYFYFKRYYPECLENYTGIHKDYDHHVKLFGNTFFFPIENFQWAVCGVNLKPDERLTNMFKEEYMRIIKWNPQLEEVVEKLHTRCKENCYSKESRQLETTESDIIKNILKQLMIGATNEKETRTIMHKFLVFLHGGIGETEEAAKEFIDDVIYRYKENNKLDEFKLLLRCFEAKNFSFHKIVERYVKYGTLEQIKAITEVAGRHILHIRCTELKFVGPTLQFLVCSPLYGLESDLDTVLKKLQWMIDEHNVDPTVRDYAGRNCLENFQTNYLQYRKSNRDAYDHVCGFLSNEIKRIESTRTYEMPNIGEYFVLDDTAVEEALPSHSKQIRVLKFGDKVNITLVVPPTENESRVRGKIEDGWISILDTDNNYRWVTPQNVKKSLEKRTYTETLPVVVKEKSSSNCCKNM